jgi:hypothetical protein
MRFVLTALVTMQAVPAFAGNSVTYPVAIPQECVVLAQREGVPTLIENRFQAARARVKLARLKNGDPLVSECKAAVDRAKVAAGY